MNTIKFLNSSSVSEETFAADMASIRSRLFSAGICWTDDIQGQFEVGKPFRVILYTRNVNIDFKNPMTKECNGLVIGYDNDWKLLAMPQGAFCTNKISMKKLNDIYSAGNYDVYEVLDATILTLYFYDNEWKVSSTKGYDIGGTEMVDGMTFIGAIQDLMATKYKSFRLEDLKQNCSYTIALRHSKYHLFDETKHMANRTRHVPRAGVDMNSYLMVMSVADTTTGTYVGKHVAGLPSQNPIAKRDQNVHTLTMYARSAFAKYAKAHRLQNFKYKPLYGYILRAKHKSVPDEYSTIYIESELYKSIKLALYKDNHAIRALNYNKLVVQMVLNHERYEQFRIMFQQFESHFKLIEDTIEGIAAEVASRIVEQGADDSKDVRMTEEESQVNPQLLNDLTEQFKNEPDITSGIIKDALYSKRYAEYLFSLIN